MERINFNSGFIDWLHGSIKKPVKDKVAKVGENAISKNIPVAPVAPASIPAPTVQFPVPVETPVIVDHSAPIFVPIEEASLSVPTIEVSGPFVDPLSPLVEVVDAIPSPLSERTITVIEPASTTATVTLAQRVFAKLTLGNLAYVLFIASAVACVAYIIYQWKYSQKLPENAPEAIPVQEEPAIIEASQTLAENPIEEPVKETPLEPSQVPDKGWSINPDILKVVGAAIVSVFASSFFKDNTDNSPQRRSESCQGSFTLQRKTKANPAAINSSSKSSSVGSKEGSPESPLLFFQREQHLFSQIQTIEYIQYGIDETTEYLQRELREYSLSKSPNRADTLAQKKIVPSANEVCRRNFIFVDDPKITAVLSNDQENHRIQGLFDREIKRSQSLPTYTHSLDELNKILQGRAPSYSHKSVSSWQNEVVRRNAVLPNNQENHLIKELFSGESKKSQSLPTQFRALEELNQDTEHSQQKGGIALRPSVERNSKSQTRNTDSPQVSNFYMPAQDFQQIHKSSSRPIERIKYVSETRKASIPAVTTGSLNGMGPPTNLENFSDSSSSARAHQLDFVSAKMNGFTVLPNNGSPSPERLPNVVDAAQQYVENPDRILFPSNFPERHSSSNPVVRDSSV